MLSVDNSLTSMKEQVKVLREKYYLLDKWNPDSFPYLNDIFRKLQISLFSGIERMISDLFTFEKMETLYNGHDIYQKLKVLTYNSSDRFRNLIRSLYTLRNILVHNGFLEIKLIQNITMNIILLFEGDHIFWKSKSFNLFNNEWSGIYTKILSDSPIFQLAIVKDNEDKTILSDSLVPSLVPQLQNEDKTILSDSSLKYYRDNGYREILKGRKIRILDGKWIGYTVTLTGWNGTSVNILFEDGRRMSINITKLIEIL